MATIWIPVQIKTDNTPAYVSSKMKQLFTYYNKKHTMAIPHSLAGKLVVERSNHTLKEMLKSKRKEKKFPGID